MKVNQKAILVTGGAGYIGSHTVLALKQKGYKVIVLDNLVYGHRDIVEDTLQVELCIGDITDRTFLDALFARKNICAVLHFAAYAYVGESVADPGKYYRNNVLGTLTLLEAMRTANVTQLVFSSTCATYGNPESVPISEDIFQNPMNPYGASKLAVERMLRDYEFAYGIRSIVLRYFNAAGAHPDCRIGEDHTPETHLIPLTLFTAMGLRESITIFGTDYPTRDGTCIRDYVHVSDLADAHVLSLDYLLSGSDGNVFNLGNENGFSVREIISAAERVTNRKIKVVEGPRREGDPAVLVGSARKAETILGWQPQRSALDQIIQDAWHWHCYRHNEFVTTDWIAA